MNVAPSIVKKVLFGGICLENSENYDPAQIIILHHILIHILRTFILQNSDKVNTSGRVYEASPSFYPLKAKELSRRSF